MAVLKKNQAYLSLIFTVTLLQCLGNEAKSNARAIKDHLNDKFTIRNTCTDDMDCPPWMSCNNSKCLCRNNDPKHYTICNEDNLQLKIRQCGCVTYDNETGGVITGECIEGCANASSNNELYTILSLDPININKFMCEDKWNRTGRLCGKCLPGYGPLAYSYNMRCIKCPEGNANIWKYLLVAYGPLTLFYFIVLFFKINATSSHLHGFLYYSQAVSVPAFVRVAYNAMVGDATKILLFHLITPLYSAWTLDTLRSLQPEICLNVSTLTIFAIDYGLAVYPLLLTILSYTLIELHDRNYRVVVLLCRPFRYIFTAVRRNWNIRNTVIDAYVTFFLLSFVKVLNISVDILTPTRATDLVSGNSTWVLYYDGTVDYFGAEHLPYAILAIIIGILMGIIPMVVLALYPFRWFQRLISCLQVQGPIFQTIMDSFQGCYKDGTEPGTRDYRWFAAVPLIMRCLAFLLIAFSLDSSYFAWGTVGIISGLILTVIIQPYKDSVAVYAKIDTIFLGFLAITFTMIDGKNIADAIHPSVSQANNFVLGITFFAPIAYMVCLTLYKIVARMRRNGILISRLKAWRRGYQDIECGIDDSMPDRLINPEHYQRSLLQHPVLNIQGSSNA